MKLNLASEQKLLIHSFINHTSRRFDMSVKSLLCFEIVHLENRNISLPKLVALHLK